MKKSLQTLRQKQGMPMGILIGVTTALLFAFVLSALAALLIINDRIDPGRVRLLTFFTTVVSSLISGVVTGKITQSKPAISCGITVITYGLILLAVGILFFDGGLHGVWTSIAAMAIGYVGACTICISRKKRSPIRKVRSR